jgi:hypothetical protein
MAKREWFFKRGNARVSWATVPDWARWVAVDKTGRVFAYKDKPSMEVGYWKESKPRGIDELEIAHVGKACQDWQDLIFERPKPKRTIFVGGLDSLSSNSITFELHTPCKPVLPVITRAEWDAIRLLLPGAQYVARDSDGAVYATNGEFDFSYNIIGVFSPGEWMEVACLKRRFESVPWRESLVKYAEE